ncbi:LysM peptidoglycan-binding domain-containing protein [Alkalihalobacterium alkalinitrilicum]|uniref:LysM peptidoglycan-binding domain-containing protein n=1 Tax=Alkalihalobacterium alkalinitrilicum TaxID=427920 RepID=UPI000995C67F|nr:LysM peptidoglycan-binding domain-containing protein [Alkalihalobacterium alkalinitrilicum]
MFNKKNGLKMMALSVGVSAILGFAHGADAAMYEVKRGDTLFRIAQENKMTVTELKQMNNLKSTIIIPGQKLQIKDSASTAYQAKKGDTLYSISKKFNMKVNDIKKLNNLKSNTIFPGQKLIVTGKPVTDHSKSTMNKEVKLTVQNGYQFVKEEPGKYQLFSKKEPGFFARVELVDPQAKIAELKKNAQDYLKTTGNVRQVTDFKNIHPFYKGAELYMISSNSKVRQSIVIKKINGQLIKFTLHLPDKEEAEDITPNLLNQLQTIKF